MQDEGGGGFGGEGGEGARAGLGDVVEEGEQEFDELGEGERGLGGVLVGAVFEGGEL